MKIIKKAIIKIIQWATRNEDEKVYRDDANYASKSAISSGKQVADMPGMNFTVYTAVGGKVIQFSHYNMATDRNRNQLYIVTDKEDLGYELGQIITVESLTR
jgi:hypothetical protein